MRPGTHTLIHIAPERWAGTTLPANLKSERVALITGIKRDQDQFDKIIALCADLKNLGLVDRFVFSTWTDQRSNFEGLLEKLAPATLVLSRAPNGISLLGSPIHQASAWIEGLAQCNPSDIILKFRTDKCSPMIVQALAKKLQKRGLRAPDLMGGYPAIFDRRPIVPYFNTVSPFLIHDIEFVALASDFAKICNFDLSNYYFHRLPTTEGFFYGPAFADRMTIARRIQSMNIVALVDQERLISWLSFAATKPAWFWMHMLYLQIVKRYFDVGWDIDAPAVDGNFVASELEGKTLQQIMLEGHPRIGVGKHILFAGSVAYSSTWLDYINKLNINSDFEAQAHETWRRLSEHFYEDHNLDIDFSSQTAELSAHFKHLVDEMGRPEWSAFIRTTQVLHSI